MTQPDIYASRHELDAWSDHQWWDVMWSLTDKLATGEITGDEFLLQWNTFRDYQDIPARLDRWQQERSGQ